MPVKIALLRSFASQLLTQPTRGWARRRDRGGHAATRKWPQNHRFFWAKQFCNCLLGDFMTVQAAHTSNDFIWRRVHSLMGLWLVLYLFIHLTVNSQAALWIGDDGSGFIRLVNSLESLPYLQAIEIVLIGIPLLVHMVWGVKRALSAKVTSGRSDGTSPSLSYSRNRAFTWQRLTSWILLVGIVAHVVHMRFLNFPKEGVVRGKKQFFVPVTFDEGLYSLGGRLGVEFYTSEQIEALKNKRSSAEIPIPSLSEGVKPAEYSAEKEERVEAIQIGDTQWIDEISSYKLKKYQVVAATCNPGTAMLLMVRDSFKKPWLAALYTIFVLAAAFHAFNGFWTAMITWGLILSYRSQKAMIPVGWIGIALLSFLGLAAIWGSY
ncbi:MAG: hypothetical protein A3E80_03850, partial [Chlamydiae bacterium RIFCSPHIGHO2_12_FULL_49_9]